MYTAPCNPKEAKEQLYKALARFHQEWEHGLSTATIFGLCEAAEQANAVARRLEEQDALSRDTRLQLIQLHILLTTAKQALTAILEETEEAGLPSPDPQHQASVSETVFPAGTLLDCPQCGEGLYKVMQRASTAEIVLDDGALLVPLNQSIPARPAWSTLACPLCGGRLLKDGKIHTLQQGWR